MPKEIKFDGKGSASRQIRLRQERIWVKRNMRVLEEQTRPRYRMYLMYIYKKLCGNYSAEEIS